MCISYTFLTRGDKDMMKRMNFTIAEIQVKRLTSISKKTGMAASEIVRRAIDEYWERFERQGKRSG